MTAKQTLEMNDFPMLFNKIFVKEMYSIRGTSAVLTSQTTYWDFCKDRAYRKIIGDLFHPDKRARSSFMAGECGSSVTNLLSWK